MSRFSTGTEAELARRRFDSLKRAKMVGPEKAGEANALADARYAAQDLTRAGDVNPLVEAVGRYSPELASRIGAATAMRTREELGANAVRPVVNAREDAEIMRGSQNRTLVAGAETAEMQPRVLAEGIRSSIAKSALDERGQAFKEKSGDRQFSLDERGAGRADTELADKIRNSEAVRSQSDVRNRAEVGKIEAETKGLTLDQSLLQDPAVRGARVAAMTGQPQPGTPEAIVRNRAMQEASLADSGIDPERLQAALFSAIEDRPGAIGLGVRSAMSPGLGQRALADSIGRVSQVLDTLDTLPPETAMSVARGVLNNARIRGVKLPADVLERLQRYLEPAA